MSDQKQFLFQLQFGKETSDERETVVKNMIQTIENGGAEARRIWLEQSTARSYKNINVVVEKSYVFWSSVKSLLGKSSNIPKMIVTCEGDRGWDDYLLLHHYNKTHRLDDLAQPQK